MAPLDREMESVGYTGVYARIEVPAGSTIWSNEAEKRAQIIYPDGRIKAWEGMAILDVRPKDPLWEVKWMQPNLDSHRIQFSAAEDDADEIIQETGFEMYLEEIEGHENRLWPEFVRLMRDATLNPFGFPLGSGVYVHDGVHFQVNFGEDGSKPSIAPKPDTIPAPLEFPYRTGIALHVPLVVNGETIQPDFYFTKVTGYRVDTGQVMSIECRKQSFTFRLTGEEIIRLIHEGKVEIMEVIQDQMPVY